VLVATWNVNSLKARLERVTAWIADVRPDVLCMQETKMKDAAFPALAFEELGYATTHFGDGQWNGVAIASRVGLENARANFADGIEQDAEARIVTATCGGVRIACAYVPNGRAVDHEHYRYKLSWMARLRDHAAALAADGDTVVTGDFNIAPTDADVWDPAALAGATHVSTPERDSLAALMGVGLRDVVRDLHPEPGIYSWWDYRNGSFHRGWGMRIDLVLATTALAARATWSTVDRNARKGEQPSDHAPVLVDFA
jgi:exodeoxyribonuclease-3